MQFTSWRQWLKRASRSPRATTIRRHGIRPLIEALEDRFMPATLIWDGGGADNNWTTGLNWNTDTAPGGGDIVVFNNTSSKNATVNAAFAGTVAAVQIDMGYIGTIDLARDLTVNGDFSIAAGANFDMSTRSLILFGTGSDLTVSQFAGFQATSGTLIFDHNSNGATHAIQFTNISGVPDTGTLTVNNFTLRGTGNYSSQSITTIADNSKIVVNGTFTQQRTALSARIVLNGGFVDLKRDAAAGAAAVIGPGAYGGSTVVTFNGTTDQSFTYTGNIATNVWDRLGNVVVDNPGRTVAGTPGTTNLAVDHFTLANGNFTAPSGNLTVLGNFTLNGIAAGTNTFSAPATLLFDGPELTTHNVNIDGAAAGTLQLNNLTVGGIGNYGRQSTVVIASGDKLVVGGNLLQQRTGGDARIVINGGAIDLKGNATAGPGASGGTTVLTFNGNGAQTIGDTGNVAATTWDRLGTVVVDKTSGAVTASTGNIAVDHFTLNQGTFSAPTGNMVVLGNFTVNGIGAGTSTFNAGTGTLFFDGPELTTHNVNLDGGVGGTLQLNNLTVGGVGNYNRQSTVVVSSGDKLALAGDFRQQRTGGSARIVVNGGAIDLAGNATAGPGASGGTTVVTLNGTGAQTIGNTGNTAASTWDRLGNVVVDKTSGVATASTTNVAVDHFTLNRGNFSAPSGNLVVLGNFTVNGIGAGNSTFNAGTGTLFFDGFELTTHNVNIDGAAAGTLPLNNLTVGGIGNYNRQSTVVVSSGDKLVLAGNFLQQRTGGSARIVVNGGAIDLAGNATAGPGASGGTTALTLNGNGAQTIGDTGNTASGTWDRLGPIVINKTSGAVTASTASVAVDHFTLNQGAFTAPTGNFVVLGDFNVNNVGCGDTIFNAGATGTLFFDGFTSATHNVNINGATPGALLLNNLTIGGTGNYSAQSTTILAPGDLLIVDGDYLQQRTGGTANIRLNGGNAAVRVVSPPGSITHGAGDVGNAAVVVAITTLPAVPVVNLPGPNPITYTQGNPPLIIDTNAGVTDTDATNFQFGTLAVHFETNGLPEDVLGIRNEGTGAGQIGVSGSLITFGGPGNFIGSFTGGSVGTPLIISLSNNATPAAVTALLRNITYVNTSATPSTLQRTVEFCFYDGNGGYAAPVTKSINVVESALPTSTITFPANNGVYNAIGWTDNITGTADGTGSAVSAVGVSVFSTALALFWDFNAGTPAFTSATEVYGVATVTPTSATTATWTIPFLDGNFPADGSYTVNSQATDSSGNVQTPDTVAGFTYDTTLPTSAISFPVNGNAYNGTTWTDSITGTADGTGSAVTAVGVSVFSTALNRFWDFAATPGFTSATEVYGAATVVPSGTTATWSIGFLDTNFPADGNYVVNSRATDAAGNLQNPDTAASFTYDTALPTSAITFPVNGGAYNATSWTDSITGTADGMGSAVSAVGVSVFSTALNRFWDFTSTGFISMAEVYGVATVVPSGTTATWSIGFLDANFPADGNYVVNSRATDAAGNVQNPDTAASFTYDTALPTSAITFPANGGAYNATSWTDSITGTANGTGSAVVGVGVSIQNSAGLFWNGTSFGSVSEIFNLATVVPSGTTATWSLAFADANFPANGTYVVNSQATDAAGNVQSPDTAASFVYDTALPTSTITFPVNGASYASVTWTDSITGTADGTGSAVAGVGVSIQVSGGLFWNGASFSSATELFFAATVTPVTATTANWTLAFSDVNFPATATYVVNSRATDAAGNVQTPDTASSFTFDATIKRSTVGIYNAATATWYLRNTNTAGAPDITPFAYGWGGSTITRNGAPFVLGGSTPIVGDWDGDGDTTIGVYDPMTATWYLRNSNSAGPPTITPFAYGFAGAMPVVGDWDGNGTDTIGLYNPANATWYLRNTNSAGPADLVFAYGFGGALPVVGDWDGSGTDTIGVYNPGNATWYLRNSNDSGAPSIMPFAYGFGNNPVVGDWDGNGATTVGVYNPGTAQWFLRNSNSAGAPSVPVFAYGFGSFPVVGDWNFPAAPLHAAGPAVNGSTTALTGRDLENTVSAALDRLALGGLDSGTLARLGAVHFQVGDLPANYLGQAFASAGRVVLDTNAAGYGWFVDATPFADEEFADGSAPHASPAAGRMDLLSAVLHELGHIAGLSHGTGVMTETLAPGIRSLDEALDAYFAR